MTQPPDSASPAVSMTDMRVDLDIVLAQQSISVGQLSSWLQGGVVALPGTDLGAAPAIEIRQGGKLLATGRLVKLDDCYGVEIEHSFIAR